MKPSNAASPKSVDASKADLGSTQDLLTYRIEEAVKERVSKWASRQLATVAALANLVILLGVGTVAYNFMKTTLESAVKEGVEQKILAERAQIDTAVKSYRSLVDNAVRELNDKRGEIEELKVRLREATVGAEETAKVVKKMSDDSRKDFVEFQERIAETDAQMRSASRAISDKYDVLQNNYKKWGKDIYVRASIAIDLLGRNLAELRAMRVLTDDGAYAERYKKALKFEQSEIERNSNTLVILYIQSGVDRAAADELKWELGLLLRGFMVNVVYSGSANYERSRSFLQFDTPGLEDVTYINDQCTIIPPVEGSEYQEIIAKELEGVGISTECLKAQTWKIGDDILPSIDANSLKQSKHIVISYFLRK